MYKMIDLLTFFTLFYFCFCFRNQWSVLLRSLFKKKNITVTKWVQFYTVNKVARMWLKRMSRLSSSTWKAWKWINFFQSHLAYKYQGLHFIKHLVVILSICKLHLVFFFFLTDFLVFIPPFAITKVFFLFSFYMTFLPITSLKLLSPALL